MILVQPVHGEALTSNPGSCFGIHAPRLNVDINGATLEEKNRDGTFAWADQMTADLEEIGAEGGHPVHIKDKETVEVCYGDNWKKLKELKRKLADGNVFRAVPSLCSA